MTTTASQEITMISIVSLKAIRYNLLRSHIYIYIVFPYQRAPNMDNPLKNGISEYQN